MANKYLGVPDNKELVVKGTGLSPQVSRSPSPDSSIFSDSGTERSEDYTVLDGVKEMNEMLLKQIQAIRRQIDISEKTYNEEKAKLIASKNTELRQRDNEISNLTHSLQSKDENINQLKRVGAEKDKLIQDKGVEVENLKNMIEQIQDKAKKIHKKVKRAQRKTPAKAEEDNATESLQDDEIQQLRSEMEELKVRVASLEDELAKAIEVIQEQNEQMGIMSDEKKDIEAKLSEKFKKMSESMRRDVERTCQVLLKNNEEMQQLKQQNSGIRSELNYIKNQLTVLVQQRGDKRTADNTEDLAVDEASENICNRKQVFLTTVNQTQKLPAIPKDFKKAPKLQRESSQIFTPSNQKNVELQPSYNATRARLHTHYPASDQAKRSVFLSADSTTRGMGRGRLNTTSSLSVQTLNPPVGANINRQNVIPPIAQKSKQGKPFPSPRGGVKRDPKK
ncbi:unnamed protein product [Candidula unifasciata]|uniref:Uncharacterized protein n=1 Tax=Candidula unifasciata TaxID=100452 RepID=A0A8S3YRY1_9EUPU|nr:unnamed protein product [Candidula unifasciata]